MLLAWPALSVLIIFSFFTSALSAATGMGGGVLLFTIMTMYFPIQVIIPIHGIIQFFNNFLTLNFLKVHLRKTLMIPFIWGALPGIFLASLLLSRIIKTQAPQTIILALILYVRIAKICDVVGEIVALAGDMSIGDIGQSQHRIQHCCRP